MAGITWLYSMQFTERSDDILQIVVRVTTEDEPDLEVALATGVLQRPANATQDVQQIPGQPGNSGKNINSGGSLLISGATDGSIVDVPWGQSGDSGVLR
jgi:hypothetical protein